MIDMRRLSTAALALMAAALVPATAQTTVSSSVIGTGGGEMSGGNVVVTGTLGQPVIGRTTGSATVASQGFWYTLPGPKGSAVDERVTDASPGESLELLQNAPNPFSDWTEVRLRLPRRDYVSLRLYDALGRQVSTLVDGERQAGTITLRIDASDLESGHYTAQLVAGGTTRAITMIVVK